MGKEFAGYIHVVCKKCNELFVWFDKRGEFNDVPPDKKFYCPKCLKELGKKNKTGKPTPEEFLNNNNIKDKMVRKQFKKICKTRLKNRSYEQVLKEAEEVASYYREES